MLGLCFALQYFVSFLVLQSLCGRESWLFYFCCVLNVMSLLLLTLPRGAMGWSVVCECGIPWS